MQIAHVYLKLHAGATKTAYHPVFCCYCPLLSQPDLDLQHALVQSKGEANLQRFPTVQCATNNEFCAEGVPETEHFC